MNMKYPILSEYLLNKKLGRKRHFLVENKSHCLNDLYVNQIYKSIKLTYFISLERGILDIPGKETNQRCTTLLITIYCILKLR